MHVQPQTVISTHAAEHFSRSILYVRWDTAIITLISLNLASYEGVPHTCTDRRKLFRTACCQGVYDLFSGLQTLPIFGSKVSAYNS